MELLKLIKSVHQNKNYKNSFLGVLGFLFPAIVSFTSISIFSKELTTPEFNFIIFFTTLSQFLVFLNFGIPSAVIYNISKHGEENNHLNSKTITTSLLATTIIVVSIIVVLILIDKTLIENYSAIGALNNMYSIMIFTVPFQIINLMIISIWEGFQNFKISAKFKISYQISFYVIPFIIYKAFNLDFKNFIQLIIAVVLINFIYAFYFSFKKLNANGLYFSLLKFKLERLINLVRYGSKFTLNHFINMAYTYGTFFYVGYHLGSEESIEFRLGHMIGSNLFAICSSALIFLFPLTSSIKDKSNLKTLFKRIALLVLIYDIFSFGLAYIFADKIVFVWLGNNFSNNLPEITRWFCLCFILNTFKIPAFHIINGSGKPGIILLLSSIGLTIYIFLVTFTSELNVISLLKYYAISQSFGVFAFNTYLYRLLKY